MGGNKSSMSVSTSNHNFELGSRGVNLECNTNLNYNNNNKIYEVSIGTNTGLHVGNTGTRFFGGTCYNGKISLNLEKLITK